MARKKVKLEWISNDAARKATLKKRKKGLTKKVSELSTLCDVKACMIVFTPGESQPDIWPSPSDAVRVLARLKRLPEMEQSKKMLNQETFMRQRIDKLKDQLAKLERENRELETSNLLNETLSGSGGRSLNEIVAVDNITSLSWLLEIRINEVSKRIRLLRNNMKMKMMRESPKEEESPKKKRKTAMEAAMEELQRQEWFTEVMMNNNNNPSLMSSPPPPPPPPHEEQEMVFPPTNFINHGSNNPWLDSFFTFN